MQIVGYNPNSYVDYPSNIAAVIFFGGCNLDCWYCHNSSLIDMAKIPQWQIIDEDEIIEKIASRISFLDGVVLTGGEPTLHDINKLISFIKRLKDMGLLVKLDTNGCNSKALQQLVPYIDYIAMDIKAPLDKYSLVTHITESGIRSIKQSIEIVKAFGGEFRTTLIPELDKNDIITMAKTIGGGRAQYYLQQLIPPEEYSDISVHSPDTVREMCAIANDYIPTKTRGI